MDLMLLVGSGPLDHMNLIGGQTRVIRRRHQDGIFAFSLKHYHLVPMMECNCLVLLHRQIVEKVEAG